MHFCISVFIAVICLAIAVLFCEVFPKWFKAFLALLGSLTAGWAIAILIRKIAIVTNAFAKPELLTTGLICAAIVLIVTIVVTTILKKKK